MRGRECGLTIIEILIALAVFAIVVIGALGAVGATTGGFLEAVPTGLVAARSSKDLTAAGVYLEALHEHSATVGGSNINPITDGCAWNSACTFTPSSASGPQGFVLPSAVPYQLDWDTLVVTYETWVWDGGSEQYVSGSCDPAGAVDCLVLMRSTLTWHLGTIARPPLTTAGFLPGGP